MMAKVPPFLFVLSSLLVGSGGASALDNGEAGGHVYHGQHRPCATVPAFGTQAQTIGPATGDAEKDTVAYPVLQHRTVCPDSKQGSAQ
jgi:hypothetical protein